MLNTHFLKFHVNVKVNLDNYNYLTNPKEHIQNTRSILELITKNSDVIYNILPIISCKFARVWYHSFGMALSLSFTILYEVHLSF
ncbi:hypothetical protein NC651_013924 [Populus alba x Populus x berolinensis]|nr:hypothetical protein NC651_013924 [Populus alba x Populus x berolinensis]